jgi:hypothetical protein
MLRTILHPRYPAAISCIDTINICVTIEWKSQQISLTTTEEPLELDAAEQGVFNDLWRARLYRGRMICPPPQPILLPLASKLFLCLLTGVGCRAKSYDREKAWSSTNPSIVSVYEHQIKIYKNISLSNRKAELKWMPRNIPCSIMCKGRRRLDRLTKTTFY